MKPLTQLRRALLVLLISTQGASAADIYVYANATAPFNGSKEAPHRTIGAALKHAKPGDTVLVRAGVYRESLNVPSGAADAPVTLKAEAGQRVVVSGFQPISGWKLHKDNVYVTTLDWKPDALYVGNAGQPMSREPNEGWHRMEAVGDQVLTDTAHLVQRPDNLVGGEVQFHQRWGNVFFNFPISAYDATAGTVTLKHDNRNVKWQTGDRYLLKNRASLIDQPGEWAVEAEPDGKLYRLYFAPRHTNDLKSTQVRRINRPLVSVNGGQHIRIEGLEVAGAAGSAPGLEVSGGASDIIITRCIVHNNGGTGIRLRNVRNVTVSQSVSLHNSNGITLASGRNVTIEQNEVGYNMVDGINITGDISGRYGKPDANFNDLTEDVTVQRNYVHHHLLWAHPDNFQLYRGVKNVRFIENLALGSFQGLFSEEVDGGELIGNVMLSSSSNLVSFGHKNSNNWKIHRNTFAFPGYTIYSFTGEGYDVRENVYLGPVTTVPSYTGDHNLYGTSVPGLSGSKAFKDLAEFSKATGQDPNSLNADPLLMSVPIAHSSFDGRGESNATTLALKDSGRFKTGDHIEVNWDGVVRTVTAVEEKKITFTPALPARPMLGTGVVANWGNKTNSVLDTRLQPESPGTKLATDGGAVGSAINVPAYRAGDFNDDGRRDLPILPDDVRGGLPSPNNPLLPTW